MMAQKKEKRFRRRLDESQSNGPPTKLQKTYDPTLAELFQSSLGPSAKPSATSPKQKLKAEAALVSEIPDTSGAQSSSNGSLVGERARVRQDDDSDAPSGTQEFLSGPKLQPTKKRKRKYTDDDLEGTYLRKLAKEEAREDASRSKKESSQNTARPAEPITNNPSPHLHPRPEATEVMSAEDDVYDDSAPADTPQHESLGLKQHDSDVEKASRTVFLGNVSNFAIKSKSGKKALLDHLGSFLPALPDPNTPHKVESLRFRSTAFSSSAVPKKAAFAKKELMDSTMQSTNAYAVYTTQLAAREAAKRLNGTIVLDRHLRVDPVAHPAKTDHRRCVFIGNLGFVDDESVINAAEDEANGKRPRKAKEPADLEEGLWRQFGKAGAIESVRVPRDKTTRVGKGFAYVQFKDPNGVEKALLLDGKKFPPMLPRILRVTRAKDIQKTTKRQPSGKRFTNHNPVKEDLGAYRPKVSSDVQSMSGRAGKLLGRAGAARFQGKDNKGPRKAALKTPESIVFEGYRASSRHGKGTLQLGGSGKKQGKPRTRSSKRAATFKASSKKK